MAKRKKTQSTFQDNNEYKTTILLLNNNIRKLKQVLGRKRFQEESIYDKANILLLKENLKKMEKLKEEIKTKAINQEIFLLNGETKTISEEFSDNLQLKVAKAYSASKREINLGLLDSIKQQVKDREKEARS
jgi:hypothetical protein